jgi:hypothetical protein
VPARIFTEKSPSDVLQAISFYAAAECLMYDIGRRPSIETAERRRSAAGRKAKPGGLGRISGLRQGGGIKYVADDPPPKPGTRVGGSEDADPCRELAETEALQHRSVSFDARASAHLPRC